MDTNNGDKNNDRIRHIYCILYLSGVGDVEDVVYTYHTVAESYGDAEKKFHTYMTTNGSEEYDIIKLIQDPKLDSPRDDDFLTCMDIVSDIMYRIEEREMKGDVCDWYDKLYDRIYDQYMKDNE